MSDKGKKRKGNIGFILNWLNNATPMPPTTTEHLRFNAERFTSWPSCTRILAGDEREVEPHSPIQYNKGEALDEFWKRKLDAMTSGCIVPVGELSYDFRSAIDKGYSTGWTNLNNILQGLRLGEVTVITADTGVGNTTFCTQLVVNCAMQNIPVWINSWEMKPETTLRKLASVCICVVP